jgi:spore coat protein A, manganese oxidase
MTARFIGLTARLAAGAALAAATLGVSAVSAAAWGGWSGGSGGGTLTPFTQPLKIPGVLQPSRTDATTDYYSVSVQAGTANIVPGKATPVWTYNGSFPGPTIVANKGRPVSVHVTNQLGEAMSVHLHGGHQPSIYDGLPNDLVAFGASKDYNYPASETARTMWYHDHARDVTARHVWNGLAGFYLIHDSQEAALNLPTGGFDVPLMLMNRAFSADGTMPYQDGSGDTMLVNGVPQPYFRVEARKYRFRLLNASNDDFYSLSLGNSQAMVQVANEGGLLPAPVSRSTVSLAPAERADVVIDFSQVAVGTSVKLTGGSGWRSGGDVMRFDVVARSGADTSVVPATLRGPLAKLNTTGAPSRTFTLDRSWGGAKWQINGHGYDPAIYDAQPRLGGTEIWTFKNNTGDDHPLHVHDVNFQVLSTDGSAPTGADASWKETVNVPSRGTVKVAARFDDHTGTYVFHCHRLEHEDNMMMSQFKVIP